MILGVDKRKIAFILAGAIDAALFSAPAHFLYNHSITKPI
jgi:hypothetical protein